MDLKRKSNIFLEDCNKFDLYNGCCNNEDLKVLNIGHVNSSIRIVLCKECREKLIAVLDEDIKQAIEEQEEEVIRQYDITFSKDKKKCIIYSKHAIISPLNQMREIKEDIKNAHIENDMEMYFDFLICFGNVPDRFAKAHFYKNQDSIRDFEFLQIGKQDILRKISANYYKDQEFVIDNSILTSVQKKMIKKGIAI